MSVNKVILVGNVGKDPETRYLEGGTVVSRFPFATSEVYKNRAGEKITNTEWHNIVAWRGLAEIMEKYVTKGSQLYIEGRIRNRSYTDKEGNTRYTTEIVADNIQMLGKRSDDNDTTENQSRQTSDNQQHSDNQQNQLSGESRQKYNDQNTNSYDGLTDGSDETDDLPF
ncbi:MAG: single-stranded DNA-binding protein [Bacteroidota bacterium]